MPLIHWCFILSRSRVFHRFDHISHIHVPFIGKYLEPILQNHYSTKSMGVGWGVVGVRGRDTDDTFHTILQHTTETVLHSFWWHSFIFKRWLSYMSWQSIYMTVKVCTCQINSALQWCSKTRRFFNTLRPRKWPPISRRHFQMHFLQWKCMNFD